MISKAIINNLFGWFGVEIHGKGYLQSLAKGEFKGDSYEIQKEYIRKKDPVIFDVGANNGEITGKYLESFPGANIFAFEPFPEMFLQLKSKFGTEENIHCIQKAVSSHDGKKEFYVNKNVDTNSLLRPVKLGLSSDVQVSNISTIIVDLIVLDEFCLSENIDHIDILKMDIQGGEFDALKGLDRMLSKSAIDLIYSEVYFAEQYESQPLFHDISQLLCKYGYYLKDIYNPIYGKGNLVWADVIFVKK